MMKISSFIVAFSLYIMVLVNTSQQQQLGNTTATCNFTACNSQRTPCSSNSDCECLSLTTKPSAGICALAFLPCTGVVPCNADNKTCPIDNTVCVNSTRCGKPVCYPLALANKLVCPAVVAVTNGTTTTTRTSITTRAGNTTSTTTPTSNRWFKTGNMTNAREWHTASVLNNGKVLVSGGFNGGPVNSAELYDPSTGNWTTIDIMTNGGARYRHTASVLKNGKVLFAGGFDGINGGTPKSAVLYDPSTGNWGTAGSMAHARIGHTASVLNNGKLLVSGGYNYENSGTYLNSTELYDPSTGIWTRTGDLIFPRVWHTASVLNNGKVLVSGGYNEDEDGFYLDSAELYDPSTGTWVTTGKMTDGRQYHTASVLNNGKVLVSGGNNFVPINSAELYDSSTGIWTPTGDLIFAREWHRASVLNNGKVLVSGGLRNGAPINSAELYNPSTGTWVTTGNMTTARQYHTASVLNNGKVLASGGINGGNWNDGIQKTAELY